MVHGSETTGRPFEEYLDPIREMLNDDSEFRVYWPVRVPGVEEGLILQIAPEPVEEDEDGPIADPDAPEAAEDAGVEAGEAGDEETAAEPAEA